MLDQTRMPVRRRRSYQRLYRTKSYPTGRMGKEPPATDEDGCEWCLVDTEGYVHRLPKTMIFLGKEECDIEVQTDSVDKRHAVVTFDTYLHKFKIKDLSTTHGTFVNDSRIPEQEYVALEQDDCVQLGQGPPSTDPTHPDYAPSKFCFTPAQKKTQSVEGRYERAVRRRLFLSEIKENNQENYAEHDEVLFSEINNKNAEPGVEVAAEALLLLCEGATTDKVLYKMEKYLERKDSMNNNEDEPPDFVQSNHDLPSWATNSNSTSEDLQSPMAECEGCIVEQRIEHTCGESIPESQAAHRDLDRSYSHDSIHSFGLGCNTWPKKRHKPKKNVQEIFAMVDTSPPLEEGIMGEQMPRVLRGTGAPMNILPDELETVKKGTPLYGQPDWWGEEEEADLNQEKQRASKAMEVVLPENPADPNSRTNVSTNPSDTPNITDQSVPSNVPDISPTRSSDQDGITNMAFTVDFGDEAAKTLDGKSLSDFMPSKIRKSFRERKEKSMEKTSQVIKPKEKVLLTEPAKLPFKEKTTPESSKTSPKEKSLFEYKSSFREKTSPDKFQTPKTLAGRAQSEGRDFSPTRQRKLDEIWGTGSSSSESSLTKRQRMTGKSGVTRSMEFDGEPHEPSYSKAAKTSVVKRRAATSGNSRTKSVIRARKAVSQEILASSTQYNADHAVYLIDKMFQNSTGGSVDNLKNKDANNSLTECDMYHEAIKFDLDQSRVSQPDISVNSSVNAGKDSKRNKSKPSKDKDVPITIQKKSKDDIPIVVDKKVDKKEEDKVSESGTYTIEEDSKEEAEARKNIDKVFGVDQVTFNGSVMLEDDLKLVSKSGDKQGDLTLNLQNLNFEFEEIEKLERLRAQRPAANSLEVDIGSRDPSDLLDVEDDNPAVPEDAPKWVTQWAALTAKKSSQNKTDMELSSPGSSISDDRDSKSNGKTPNGISRKRPGTGRRLPTIPPEATSPAMSDRSFTKESPQTPKSDLSLNGSQLSPGQRTVQISSHVSSRYQDTDSESVSLTKYNDNASDITQGMSSRGKSGSNGSVVSIDTEVLLRDTETVMAAMQQRVASKPSDYPDDDFDLESEPLDDLSDRHNISRQSDNTDSNFVNDSIDLESDTSSVVALVNGDEDFVKPSTYKSPRDVLGRGKLKLTESLPSKPAVNTGGGKNRTNSTSDRIKRRSVDERTIVSDIYSDDNVTERDSEAQFARQGSKGKGQMSMTRPNRAFALRRARADGDEGAETSRSTSQLSTASTGFSTPRGSGSLTNVSKVSTTPQKPRRPMSGKFADRQPDSGRSQASLGTKIVQKSRDNVALSSSQNFERQDGGRHSLRVSRSMSIPTQQPGTPKQRKSTGGSTPSSQIQHSKSLRVTGVSARERSSSLSKQPGANSPKAAERNAWKRRKEYDPRKAVAEAKSKSKETSKPKTRETNVYRHRGVTRSASFNNAKDLKLSSYQCDSLSSADELSRRSSNVSDVFDDEPRRGFVPYSGRSMVSSKVSNSSADDDDIDKYVRSSSTASTQAKPVPKVAVHVSAFTPPPQKPLPLSVFKPSPKLSRKQAPTTRSNPHPHSRATSQPTSRSKVRLKTPEPAPSSFMSMSDRRRSVDSLELYKSALGHRRSSTSKESPRVPESYDTLIVSSVYQLSVKLKSSTERTMHKLRESDVIENGLESPLDELENESAVIPLYKSANQELAGVLKNLRKLEQHIKVMNKALFPDEEQSPDTSKEKHEYMQQIERIRNELAGFQPIETPREDVWKQTDTASVESDCEELSHGDYY